MCHLFVFIISPFLVTNYLILITIFQLTKTLPKITCVLYHNESQTAPLFLVFEEVS